MTRAAEASRRFSASARSALSPASRGITLLTLGCLALYLVHGIFAHLMFRTSGYDLGIFDQAVRAYAHLDAPVVPFKGPDYNIFGDHFHPVIASIAPLYWVFDTPYVLIVVQALLVAASIPVVHRFTARRASAGMSLLVAGVYGLGWPLLAMIDFDFHEVAFATPIAALAIDALDRRNDRQLFVWALLLLLVREDMGIVVAAIGFVRLLQSGRKRLPAFGLMVAGVVAYLVVTSLVIPAFATDGYAYSSQYDALGDSLPEILVNLVIHPWQTIELLFSPVLKARTLAYLFLPLALLPLRSPYVLIALPLLAGRMFNSREALWLPIFHYDALPWLILVLAMVDGAGRMGLFAPEARAARWRKALAVWLVVASVVVVCLPFRHSPHAPWDLRSTLTAKGETPATRAQWNAVLDFLPRNTCVEAENKLAPHLTTSNYVSLIDTQRGTADFVVVNTVAKDTGGNDPRLPAEVLADYLADDYVEVFRAGPVLVLQSPTYAGPSAACEPLGPGNASGG